MSEKSLDEIRDEYVDRVLDAHKESAVGASFILGWNERDRTRKSENAELVEGLVSIHKQMHKAVMEYCKDFHICNACDLCNAYYEMKGLIAKHKGAL